MDLLEIAQVRTTSEQISHNYKYRDHLNGRAPDNVLEETLSRTLLEDTHYEFKASNGQGVYFIHKGLLPVDAMHETAKILTKMAPAELKYNIDNNGLSVSYIQHIYVRDKYLEYRNLPDCTVDRFDTLILGKDKYKKDKEQFLRHQGTKVGPNAKRIALKAKNMPMIRYMQQGNNNPLTCRVSGIVVEDVTRTAANGEVLSSDLFNLHHMLVYNGTSAKKLNEDPGALITQTDLTNSSSKILDLLGTICLSVNEHKIIHSRRETDIGYFSQDELPWALQSKSNFNQFANRYLVPLGTTVTYQSFIDSLKLVNYVPPVKNNEIVLNPELFGVA